MEPIKIHVSVELNLSQDVKNFVSSLVKAAPAAPAAPEPSELDKRRMRMAEIEQELASMDYLTSKYIDGEDMSEYGDWQGKRKALREEYRRLEEMN